MQFRLLTVFNIKEQVLQKKKLRALKGPSDLSGARAAGPAGASSELGSRSSPRARGAPPAPLLCLGEGSGASRPAASPAQGSEPQGPFPPPLAAPAWPCSRFTSRTPGPLR